MQDVQLGVIGLGRMGGRIAARLAGEGRDVLGFDPGVGEVPPDSAVVRVTSVEEVATRCAVVALSLPTPRSSEEVVAQIADVADRVARTIVDLSTIGMASSRACAATAAAAGIDYLDAPVSGGTAGAAGGTLAVMVAGPGDAVTRVRPVLEAIARQVFVVGTDHGSAQAMKLLNNFVSSVSLAATSEAVVFGRRAGLDLTQMVDVLNASSGRTTASTDKLPRSIVPGTYDFGFAAEAMYKDVDLYLREATGAGSPHLLAERVEELWRSFVDACPGTDFTAIHRYLESAPERGDGAGPMHRAGAAHPESPPEG